MSYLQDKIKMAAESKLQSRIVRHLKRNGWLVTKHTVTSRTGWPDLEAIKFRTVRIEVKALGRKPTKLQEFTHSQIRNHGGEVFVVDSWEAFMELHL